MCTNCNSTPTYYSYPLSNCTNCSSSTSTDATLINYTGPNLLNIDVESNTDLQTILANIDTAVGAAVETNWGDFDYSCLTGITDAQSFAETISSYVCDLNTEVSTFIDTTFPAQVSALEASITSIDEQGLTSCTFLNIEESDNLTAVLSKLITGVCSINTTIDPSGANWNQCYTVSPAPDTITEAFNVIIDWVCEQKALIEAIDPLPTFNNTGTCIPSGGETDTLEYTVTQIRDLVCEAPSFDIDELLWTSCIVNPNPGGGADLTSALNTILTYLDVVNSYKVTTFDADYFVVTGDSCSGLTVSLDPSVGLSDKLVALDNTDTDPDYLLNKMSAGANISFDTTTSPGTVIIDCDAEDVLVKADAADTSAGYLIDKIDGQTDSSSAISILETYNGTTDKVDLTPSINYGNLAEQLLATISADNTLLTTFCGLVCGCQPCAEGDTRYVYGIITNVNEATDDVSFTISFTQTTPNLTFYSSGATVLAAGDITSTGAYLVTSASVPTQGTFSITNDDGVDNLPYSIYVLDENGDAVAGSTTQSGTLTAGQTLTISPFTYGSVEHMKVYVDLGTAPATTTTTTTTTSSTTTTTTTLP